MLGMHDVEMALALSASLRAWSNAAFAHGRKIGRVDDMAQVQRRGGRGHVAKAPMIAQVRAGM